jgi:hypothetical protein
MGAVAVVLASRTVVASHAFSNSPDYIAIGVTLDLTLTMAVLFWLTLVRGRVLPPTTIVAVLLAGVSLASAILPAGHRSFPARLAVLSAPMELALLAWIAWSATRIIRSVRLSGASLPFEEALRLAARRALGPYRSVDALASEATLVFFGLFSWRHGPHVPAGAVPFWVHRRSGAGAVLAAILLAGVAETLAAHFLIAHWSSGWAWMSTGASVYSAFWLLGDWRAMALRPVLVSSKEIQVRIGLRWRAAIPLTCIQRICPGPDPVGHPDCAVASAVGAPNLYLHLAQPVELEGLFGLRRRGECIGIRVDEPAALELLLRQRCEATD